jgi:hypothetical protein
MHKYDKDGKIKEVQTINPLTNTKYDGGVPERFLEHCATGGSIPQFCRNERISRSTFDDWIERYNLKDLKPTGKLWAEGWWMQQAQNNLVTETVKEIGEDITTVTTTKFDTSLYKFVAGGRFGHTSDKNLSDSDRNKKNGLEPTFMTASAFS